MSDKYILDDKGNPVVCNDLLKWAGWYEKADRHIGKTEVGQPTVKVSTVFLGLDHQWEGGKPPLLFETMIFGGKHDEYMRRYSTKAEAGKGHAEIVELLKKGQDPDGKD